MRRLSIILAFAAAAVAATAPPAAADHCWADIPPCWDGVIDCADPAQPGRLALCYEVWVEADPGACVREPHWDECAQEPTTCTLSNPPTRCGNRMVAFGFAAPP